MISQEFNSRGSKDERMLRSEAISSADWQQLITVERAG